jgi:sigma-B regulation protein RsbU (phosphoserine phosphatase)
MLIIALLPLFITGIVAYNIMSSMRDSLTGITDKMGGIVASSSANAIRSHIHTNNAAITELTARLVDERLAAKGAGSPKDGEKYLEALDNIIGNVDDSEGHTLLLANDGRVLVDEHGNISDENFNDGDDSGKHYIARSAASGRNETQLITVDGEMVYIAVAPCERIDAAVVFILPESSAEANVTSIRDGTLSFNETIKNEINDKIAFGLTVTFAVFAAATVAAMLMSLRFSNAITSPIELLTKEVSKIGGEKDFGGQVDVRTGDEIEALADSFNLMTQRLQGYITELERTASERERARTELTLVKNIRDMAFPHILPAYMDRNELDIFGTTKNEHSNTFYDYFEISTRKIAVITAEVSGGGVSSAVMMIIAKTLMEQGARNEKSVDEVLYTVNNILYEKRTEELVLSAFMGYLDIESGEFEYANAGMPVPFIHRIGDDWDFLPGTPEVALAKQGSVRYRSMHKKFMPHDRLFIYSDGVIGTKSPEGEPYGTERLYSILKHHDGMDIQELCDLVYSDINTFSEDHPSDDITMMAAEYFGRNIIETPEDTGFAYGGDYSI